MRRIWSLVFALLCVACLPSVSHAGYYLVTYHQDGTTSQVGPRGITMVNAYTDTNDGGRSGAAVSADYLLGDGELGAGTWLAGRPGSATCNAPILAHFKWIPESTNDPAPASVLIAETAYASWIGDSGSASNGIGGTYTAQEEGGISVGTRVKIKSGNTDEFELGAVTPVATASVSSSSSGIAGAAQAAVYYRAEAYGLLVKIDGTLDDGMTTVVGQNIELEPAYTPSHWGPSGGHMIDPGVTFVSSNGWSAPGLTFKDFFRTYDNTEGYPRYMQASDWAGLAAFFRWRDSVTQSPVTGIVLPQVYGQCPDSYANISHDVVVEEPSYSFQETVGQNTYVRDGIAGLSGTIIGGEAGDVGNWGMKWHARVDPPSGFSGSACFCQLIKLVRTEMNGNGYTTTSAFDLDTEFPVHQFHNTGAFFDDGDEPHDSITPECYSFHHDWMFKTWLLFLPTGGDFAPLKCLDWEWKEDFEKTGGTWPAESSLGNVISLGNNNIRVHPEWHAKVVASSGGIVEVSPGETSGSTTGSTTASTTGSTTGTGGSGGSGEPR